MTPILLWSSYNDRRSKSTTARELIDDRANDIEVSPATYREIAIKISLGKYELPEPYDVFIEREIATDDFRNLPIDTEAHGRIDPIALLSS